MLTLDNLYSVIDGYAPFEISKKLICEGEYDNSGIIVNCHQEVNKILFALDLSLETIAKAKSLKCDTLVTHHPAIYTPIKQLSVCDTATAPILLAIKQGLNVISLHLNLDFSEFGTDYYLAKACGATEIRVIDKRDYARGYGSEFTLENVKLGDFVKSLNALLNTSKTLVYGNKNMQISKVASFCGGGGNDALIAVRKGIIDADVIVTSDLQHHLIKELVESGKAVVIPTHYASENYGFYKFYEAMAKLLDPKAQTYYFDDKRFL